MITKFDTYKLYEKSQYIDFEILFEKAQSSKKAYQHKALVNKVVKDYKLNVYFASTFGTAIAFLIPVIQGLLNNSYNIKFGAYEIALLTVFAIAEILNIHTDGIKRIGETLKEKGLSGLIKNIKENLLSIYKITVGVASTIGKTIERFIEMFGYVSIGIPIWQTLVDITSQEGFDINTLPQKIGGLALGVGAFYLKNLIGRIVELLSKKSNSNEDQEV